MEQEINDLWKVLFEQLPKGVRHYLTQAANDPYTPTQLRFIKIDDLPSYNTTCGSCPTKGRVCFDKNVVKFLKEHSALPFVAAEVSEDEEIQGEWLIWNMAVKYKKGRGTQKYKWTKQFARMVNDLDGSLREEECFEDDWDCYESE